jgi:toxin-antitoxin system PIN domain toxin
LSFALDANLLLYATDRSSPFHEQAAAFLREILARKELFYLGWPSVMAYLRIATHPRIFDSPLSPEEARRNVALLLRHPWCRALSEGDGFWERYEALGSALPVRGNLVPDAHLAALLLTHGVRVLYTNDTDFRKFRELEVRDPFRE